MNISHLFPVFSHLHPSIACLVFLIGGICTQAYFSFHVLPIAALFFSFLIIGLLFFKKNPVFFLATTTFCAGMLCYAYKEKQQQVILTTFGNNSYELIATILDKNKQRNTYNKEVLTLQVHELHKKESDSMHTVDFTVLAYMQQPCTHLTVGDRVKIPYIFLKSANNERYEFFLLKEGIITSFFVPELPSLLERPSFSFRRWCFETKNNLLKTLKTKMSRSCFSFFNMLFLGNRSIDKKYFDSIKEQFKYWGLSHYLARSGLHLIIFLLCWTLLLRLIPIAQPIKLFILLWCCCLYYLFSWTTISFIRAFTIYCAYTAYTFLKIQINSLHILSLITICLLLINPCHLFFLDFQLSFGLTFALACIHAAHSRTVQL